MSFSTYEVLLRRGNGLNKTVYIHDCMSEQEARETAESMYGMEALRVLWRGRTVDFENQSNTTHNSGDCSNNSSGSDISLSQILGVGALILVAALAMIVWEILVTIWVFTVAYWPWLLGGSVLLFVLWAVFVMEDDDE
jgi:hypothetical protein